MRAARSADPSPTATRRGFGLAIRYAAAAALVMALVQGAWWLLAAAGPRGWREQALPLSAIPTTIAAAALAGWWLGRLAGRRLDAVRHAIERIHDADYPDRLGAGRRRAVRSEEHTSELQSR